MKNNMQRISKPMEKLIAMPAFQKWADMHSKKTLRHLNGPDGPIKLLVLIDIELIILVLAIFISCFFAIKLPANNVFLFASLGVMYLAGRSMPLLALCFSLRQAVKRMIQESM